MIQTNNFYIIPWEKDFLEELKSLVSQFSDRDMSKTLIVFPSARPGYYLTNRYKEEARKENKGLILPEILTTAKLFAMLEREWSCVLSSSSSFDMAENVSVNIEGNISSFDMDTMPTPTLPTAEESLDRIYRIYTCVEKVFQKTKKDSTEVFAQDLEDDFLQDFEENSTLQKIAHSFADFFPWGQSMDALFEECFLNRIEPNDLQYAETEVAPFAARLLADIGKIWQEYKNSLEQDSATTPAFEWYKISKKIEEEYPLPDTLKSRNIILAGFVEFSEVEEVLFKRLWANGANVCVHSDANLASNGKVHYACRQHKEWVKRWKAIPEVFTTSLIMNSLDTSKHTTTSHTSSHDTSGFGTDTIRVEEKESQDNTTTCQYNKHNKHNKYNKCDKLAEIKFFSAYDLHSQLEELKKDLLEYAKEVERVDNAEHMDNVECAQETDKADKSFKNISQKDTSLAILLPSSNLLMPTLHMLPEKDINVSLGYPVSRSLLGQFLENILQLQENFVDSYKWQEVLNLLQHPYTIMLTPEFLPDFVPDVTADSAPDSVPSFNDTFEKEPSSHENSVGAEKYTKVENSVGQEEFIKEKSIKDTPIEDKSINVESSTNKKNALSIENIWQDLIKKMMKEVRQGAVLVNISDLLDTVLGDYDSADNIELSLEMDTFITDFFNVTINTWESISNLEELAKALTGLMDFLLKYGQSLWIRFPIDAESLARLVESIIPSLENNRISTLKLNKHTLFSLLRSFFESERIAFEADPLEGLQILGMAESHLLHFEQIHILDCVESQLPGTPRQDPLMPDSLRTLIGLPNNRDRENLKAYTFYRLLAGAKKVYLYWQEGVESSGIQTSKIVRSRFVEELLWKEEKQRGKRLKAGEKPLFMAESHPKAPPRRKKKSIKSTKSIQESLEKLIQKRPFSASMLTTYMNCPASFYYTYLAKIQPVEELVEGNNSADFGTFIHDLLRDFYAPYLEKEFQHTEEKLEELLNLFKERHESTKKILTPESYLALTQTVPYFFEKFWETQTDIITIRALEKEYRKEINVTDRRIRLEGKIDRVHINGTTHWIVDYKTGNRATKPKTAWLNDVDFMTKVEICSAKEFVQNTKGHMSFNCEQDEMLEEISHKINNIQLPFYFYLYHTKEIQMDAAWIYLAAKSKGDIVSSLFGEEITPAACATCAQNVEKIVQYILLHMLKTPEFSCFEGKQCKWCPHAKYC